MEGEDLIFDFIEVSRRRHRCGKVCAKSCCRIHTVLTGVLNRAASAEWQCLLN